MGILIFRVDASPEIGTGHFMRCLALAQAWKDKGGEAIFITACKNETLLQRLRNERFGVNVLPGSGDWTEIKNILDKYPDSWIVLDGYHFDEAYQQKIKETGHRLLVIDDMAHIKHYYADIVLNQNLHADLLRYSCEPYTKLLLGTKYVLLRREFKAWRGKKRKISKIAKHILVTLGGADPANDTLKVVRALHQVNIPGLEAAVVIGSSNVHVDALKAEISRSGLPVRLIRNAENMPELMAWADVAIASAGTTAWELAFMGVPMILLVLAENQVRIAGELAVIGAAQNLGRSDGLSSPYIGLALSQLIQSPKMRSNMSRRCTRLVDGRGSERIFKRLQT
jgi:UDP-2,4-diacetamido-2,4,6-trideoxy-beta-L-altropyranose hydrolase